MRGSSRALRSGKVTEASGKASGGERRRKPPRARTPASPTHLQRVVRRDTRNEVVKAGGPYSNKYALHRAGSQPRIARAGCDVAKATWAAAAALGGDGGSRPGRQRAVGIGGCGARAAGVEPKGANGLRARNVMCVSSPGRHNRKVGLARFTFFQRYLENNGETSYLSAVLALLLGYHTSFE